LAESDLNADRVAGKADGVNPWIVDCGTSSSRISHDPLIRHFDVGLALLRELASRATWRVDLVSVSTVDDLLGGLDGEPLRQGCGDREVPRSNVLSSVPRAAAALMNFLVEGTANAQRLM
jgi:hypothetical protein